MPDDLNDALNQCEIRLREVREQLEKAKSDRNPAVFADLLEAVARAARVVHETDQVLKPDSPPSESGEDPQEKKLWDDGGPEGGAQGNAPVGAPTKTPPPLVGAGAARTIAEALEPPRNP